MTIQPSLIIWTVIGFVTLALILNRFLFKPVLEVMDRRNAKIKADREKKQEAAERAEKAAAEAEKARIEAARNSALAAEKALEEEKAITERLVAEKKAEYEAALEKDAAGYSARSSEIEEKFSTSVDELAVRYLKAVIR